MHPLLLAISRILYRLVISRIRVLNLHFGYSDTYNKDWRFSTNFTYTLNQNKIKSLANGALNPDTGEPIVMDYLSKGVLGAGGGPTIRLTEGGTMGDIYTNQRLRQSPNGYVG